MTDNFTPPDIDQLLGAVWSSLQDGSGMGESLAECSAACPLAAAVLLRAAVRLEFPGELDVRKLTEFLFELRMSVPEEHRYLIAPREAEAFIRSQIGGEVDWMPKDALGSEELRNALLLVNRNVYDRLAGNPARVAEARSVILGEAAGLGSLPSVLQDQLCDAFHVNGNSREDFPLAAERVSSAMDRSMGGGL